MGDALGVPYEFHPPEQIPEPALIELEPPRGFSRAHARVPAGTWSDDGAHALCLLASLLHRDALDLEDLGRRLVNWYEFGYMAGDCEVFAVGVQTAEALTNIRAGVPALQAGPAGEHANGNGSLMRVLPLVLWHRGEDAALACDAMLQSRVTHGHMRAQLCCALYCLWARRTLEGAQDAWEKAVALQSARNSSGPSGPTLGMAAGSYEQVVKAAIALGHDTDTTAAVAGGVSGLRDGLDAIPERWRSALRGRELVEPLLQQLLARGECSNGPVRDRGRLSHTRR